MARCRGVLLTVNFFVVPMHVDYVAAGSPNGAPQTGTAQWQYGNKNDCLAFTSVKECCEAAKCGASSWGEVYPSCAEVGTQSPVDLAMQTASISEDIYADDLVLAQDLNCTKGTFTTNLHTDEVVEELTCPGKFTATLKGKVYRLKQFHYHSPSEHTYQGEYFPMEVHYVHEALDGSVLVIGVLIGAVSLEQLGSLTASNASAAKYLRDLQVEMPWGDHPDTATMIDVLATDVASSTAYGPYDFIPPDIATGFITYEGSFTTPPCTTGVRWILSPYPRYVDLPTLKLYRQRVNDIHGNQLNSFESAIGPEGQVAPHFSSSADMPMGLLEIPTNWNTSLGVNARPIQALTGGSNSLRKLYTTKDTSKSRISSMIVRIVGYVIAVGLAIAICVLVIAICVCSESRHKEIDRKGSGGEDDEYEAVEDE